MNFCRFLLLMLMLPGMAWAQTGLYVPAGGSYDVGDGTVDLANQNIYVAGDLIVGSGQITAQDILIAEGGRVMAGTGSIRLTRNWTNRGTFEAGSSTVYFDTEASTLATGSPAQVSGETIFWNAVIAENKTVIVATDCSIRVKNETIQPDSSEVIGPGGQPVSVELCSQSIKPVTPVTIPLWVLALLMMSTLLLARRKL